ncbi:MAG: glutamine--fructose-6-phosphate transaminase (isomerizing) [Candidatus Kaelpia aquatica]|nr:glutamine--fructose-6-phosphate transaminase (isomerizing) [Candidatus Kaelpia aquatica]
MCGIVGYLGKKDALKILEKGLERLEYRGYDSAGISVLNNGRFQTVKKPGKVEVLKENLKSLDMKGGLGLGHTRWATHGEVNECNAHPHLDCKEEIVIVHNGIIENYQKLKTELLKNGHKFRSDTDTEVIAHLIEEYYADDLEEAVRQVLPRLEGSYALMVVSEREPDKIIAARMLSPLLLGIGKDGYYLASDATALIDEAQLVIYLDDGEMAIVKEDGFSIKDFNGKERLKNPSELKLATSLASKNGFSHFMLKEIYEQPEVVKNIIKHYISQDQVELPIKDSFFEDIKRIVIVACGTAYHAGLIAEYLIEDMAGIAVTVDTSSEFRYRNPVPEEQTLFISISQSGETADTLASLRLAKEFNFKTLSLVNVESSTIARESDQVLYTVAGPEIGVASTKAYLAQIMVLQLLALKLASLRFAKDAGFLKSYIQDLKKVPLYLEKIIAEKDSIQNLALELYQSSNFLYLARGINYPNALEGALKLKEISYIHAEGYPGGEMKHGPIALIEEQLPVVVISVAGKVRDKMLSNMLEIKARKGKLIGLITEDDLETESICFRTLKMPKIRESLTVLLTPLPLQFLAYFIALKKGCDVDKPRNLAKSVTVE